MMPTLTERVQVLFSRQQLRDLQRLALSEGESVGALIRRAVEQTYFEQEREDRLQAVRELAAMDLPVSDWEQMERESVESVTP